jgi:hypothetical protein
MKAEWGGRVTKMFRDYRDGRTIQVGWVFKKRVRHTDSPETHLREAWVEVVRETEPAKEATCESVALG